MFPNHQLKKTNKKETIKQNTQSPCLLRKRIKHTNKKIFFVRKFRSLAEFQIVNDILKYYKVIGGKIPEFQIVVKQV